MRIWFEVESECVSGLRGKNRSLKVEIVDVTGVVEFEVVTRAEGRVFQSLGEEGLWVELSL